MFNKKPDEKKIKIYYKQLLTTLDLLENVWLGSSDKKFLASDHISFADILCACELEQTSEFELILSIFGFKSDVYR